MQISAAMVKELRERTGAGMMDCKQALVAVDGDIDAAVENMRKAGQASADKKAGRVAAEGLLAIAPARDGTGAVMVEVNCETDFVAKEDEFKAFVEQVSRRALQDRPGDMEALAALPLEQDGAQSIEERRRELVARIGENITLRRLRHMTCEGGRIGTYLHGGRIGVMVAMHDSDEAVARDMAMHIAASNPLAVSEADLPAAVMEKEREILKAQVADSGKAPEIQQKMITGRLAKYLREVTLLGQPFVKDTDRSVEQYLNEAGASVVAFARFEVGEGIERKSENFAEEVMAQVRDKT